MSEDTPRPSRSEKKRPRRTRALPDISALFDEIDGESTQAKAKPESSREEAPVTPAKEKRLPPPDAPLAALITEVEPEPPPSRKERTQDKLSALDDLAGTTIPKTQPSTDATRLEIPPELEAYLSPELWRKFSGRTPTRGVLLNALDRVHSILYLLSTSLPGNLVQEMMSRPVAGLVSGKTIKGTLLFSDVSGFTALSERLAGLGPEGAERLTAIMNRYFTTMLEILSWSGGTLLKFAGDATLVYFPAQRHGRQANWAVRAGKRMLRAMSEFSDIDTPTEAVTLQMKIGMATGEFLAASIGSPHRMEYVVLGPAITATMAAEGTTSGGGQLIVDANTVERLDSSSITAPWKEDFYIVELDKEQALDDFEIQAERRRARGAIPWSASPEDILEQIQSALSQIKALKPYLAPELAEAIIAHASQRRVESQYRPTTVIFNNFSGLDQLVELWGKAGTKRITSLLNTYFNAMQGVIARYGGIISRIDPYSHGTKMLALFGAPVAHEDDPQRAVSAALAMNLELEALDEINRRKYKRHLPPDWNGPIIQHRFGITFGETFAGQVGSSTRREYTVMGDDVNLAARLMGAAEMGQILISQRVYDAAADFFVLTPMPPIRVKGKQEPITIYQVDGPRDDTLADRARHRGPMLGRETEIAQGEKFLHTALQGSGSLLSIRGPSGVGKSHLADELTKRATELGVRIQSHHCRSYQNLTPYACWRALLRSLAEITALDLQPQVHYAKLERLATSLDLPQEYLPPLASLLGLRISDYTPKNQDPIAVEGVDDKQPEEDIGALSDLVKRGGMRRRGSSLDVLHQIEDSGPAAINPTWQDIPLQTGDRRNSKLLSEVLNAAVWALLQRFTDASPAVIFFEDAHWMDDASRDVLRYLQPRLVEVPLLIMLAQRCDEQDETLCPGEPLTLAPLDQSGTTLLVANLLASDLAQVIYEQTSGNPLFVSEITRWFKRTHNISSDELKSALQTSDFLHKLILSDLEVLPEAEREIARIASVIGNDFRTGEVQALLPSSVDSVTLSNHLRGLARENLISLTEAGADARYAFQQTIVRDILYSSLPFEQRRELHTKIAQYLSQPLTKRRKVHARIAAALEATDTNPAVEAETIANHYEQAQDWLPAAEQLVTAGDHAREQNAYQRAGVYYQQAIANLEKLAPEGQEGQVVQLRITATTGLGDAALLAGDYITALTAFEAALADLPEEAPLESVASLSSKVALVLPTQGRASQASQLQHKVLKNKKARSLPFACATMAWLLWRSEKPEAAEWIQICQELISPTSNPWEAGISALLVDFSGDLEAAQADYSQMGVNTGAALAAVRLGDACLSQDDQPGALSHYSQAEELWRAAPQLENGLVLALYRQAEIHWRLKDAKKARALLNKALAALPESALTLQADGRSAIQKGLKVVSSARYKRWPAWDWQPFDDTFRISLLFPL